MQHQGQPPKTTVWITTTEAGVKLRLSNSQVTKLVQNGTLVSHKIRGRNLIQAESADRLAWVRAEREKARRAMR